MNHSHAILQDYFTGQVSLYHAIVQHGLIYPFAGAASGTKRPWGQDGPAIGAPRL
jgi:hypothetical protein